MKKKNKAGGIALLYFRQHYEATVIKTVWYWHKNSHVDQWDRVETLEINPNTYSQLIFDKEGKGIKLEKYHLLSKWCYGSWTATFKSIVC